jgi:hypothetical protein
MKRISAFLSCLIFALALSGCEQQGKEISSQTEPEGKTPEKSHKVQAGESQNKAFPKFLVGVWVADRFEWAFKFEPDGSILKLNHMVAGKVKVEEGGVYMEGPDEGTFAMFSIGPCEARYDPNNRQLSVKIMLDRFFMRLPSGDLEGRE